MRIRSLSTALLACSLVLAACGSSNESDDAGTDRPIVLVHGAWQDASSWERVQQELEDRGHTVATVELPGRDGVDAGSQSLDGYRDTVIAEVERHDEPVLLVGHSFGGMTISAVAEAIPDQISSLVYLAAYLPQDGDSLSSLAEQDHLSVLPEEGNLNFSDDFSLAIVPEERFAGIFCPDCADADVAAVTASVVDEPAAPLAEPISLSETNFGAVPKAYVLTAQDTVVGTQLQASMAAKATVDQLFVLDTGHAPYVSAATDFVDVLEQLG